MTMTTRSVTAGLALALTAALTVTAAAQDSQAPRSAQGRGMAGRAAGALVPLRGLDLTDAQREQIRTLVAERRQADRPAAQMGALRQQLRTAVLADTPDLSQIESLKTVIAEADAAALAARVDLQLQIAQILTPEQRVRARDLTPRGPRGPGRRQGRPSF